MRTKALFAAGGRWPTSTPDRLPRKRTLRRGRPAGVYGVVRCDCGARAEYRLRVAIIVADDEPTYVELLLCEACYALEADIQQELGHDPPRAVRLG